jgi:hypothetical protein
MTVRQTPNVRTISDVLNRHLSGLGGLFTEKVHQRRSCIAQRLNVRRGVRFASSLATALLDGHCEHPAWQLGVTSTIKICDSTRSQPEFFRSLLEVSRSGFEK